MNISTPIGTEITAVNFGLYSPEDVERISVKQIVNPTVFDNLGHPTSGGLYDLALGPFLGKSSCATCHLDERYCPGHFGHILLPQPVYHPLLFKSMMTLLKATCVYCHHFRLAAIEVHRYASKLKLLSRGLVLEAQVIDQLGQDPSTILRVMDIDAKDNDDERPSDDEEGDEGATHRLIQKREKFVQGALRRAQIRNYVQGKTTAAAEERKAVVRECLKKLGGKSRCAKCSAISPRFKQEENTKVFEISLSGNSAKYMAERGMNRVDVNFDDIKNLSSNGAARDVMMDEDEEEEEEDETGEAVMSENEVEPAAKAPKKNSQRTQEYILSSAVRNHLRRLFENESAILTLLFNVNGSGIQLTADNFFFTVIVVPPTRYRPPVREGETIRESPQNTQLTRILNTCQRIAQLNVQREGETAKNSTDKYRYLHQQIDAFVQLQLDVNSLVDSSGSQSLADRLSGRVPPPGIKQTLEKKEGLFRKHMMGKRVNYAARSVISPDPNIDTNEIGIPPFIAQKLTFPEPVTPWNVEKLRRAVINGPRTYPGASYVEQEDGKTTSLEPLSLEQRTALANTLLTPSGGQTTRLTNGTGPAPIYLNKKVHRHLETGDILLVNRQPTLHKPSIMGHKAKVLTMEKTIRLHYANCYTYNADFDGDEMNVHFPQNSLARAEAYNIANTDNQYLGPTNGNPLRGLIQDHISVAVWMTKRDMFFTRGEYQQLLYGSILPEEGGCGGHEGRIIMLTPAIRKPRLLWTGKQVVSSILFNLTPRDRPGLYLDSKSQVKASNWAPPNKNTGEEWRNSEEQHVIFDNGELLCGILDRAQIGPSSYGFVHSIYEIYGADVAGKLLSAMGRLFTKYSQMLSISCGMEDIRISQVGREMRKRVLSEKVDVGKEVAVEYVGLKDSFDEQLFLERMEDVIRDPEKLSGLDRAMQRATSGLTTVMYKELVPVHLIKKFPYNNMQLMTESKAKGGGDNANLISSIIGQQSLEGGRVPIMVSGKTLPSFEPFDPDIRAGGYVTSCYLTGIKPHEYFFYCMAGREGLIDTAVKTSRSGYLQRCLVKHLEGMSVRYDNTVRDSDGSLIQFLYGEDGLDVAKQKHLLDFNFSARNWRSLVSKYAPKNAPEWLADKTAGKYAKKALKKTHKYDPVLSKYSPSRNLGSTSETFRIKLNEFIEAGSQDGGIFSRESEDLTAKKFRALMELKYLRSLIDPGEAVGVLAAQSIGEPSTQMTLNTFHLAGFGAGNVTLGVPRLREIIMTASRSIKTPNIRLTTRPHVTDQETEWLAKRLSRVILSQLVDEIVVTERFVKDEDELGSSKIYVVRLRFFPRKEYEEEYAVTAKQVQNVLSTQFMRQLAIRVKFTVKKTSGGRKRKVGVVEAAPNIGQGKKSTSGVETGDERITGGNGGESDDDDNDYDHQKRARQTKEQGEYDGPDDEDRAMIRREDEEDVDEDEITQDELGVKKHPKAQFFDKFAVKSVDQIDIDDMKLLNPNLIKFSFDASNGEWCEMEFEYPLKMGKILMENVIEKVCQACIIREIPGISHCVKLPNAEKQGPTILVAEGRNLTGLWDLGDLIDLNVLSSNDIGAIMDTYGVEAGRACIINEINSIFGMYTITVDMRHLSLIADYMTFGGGYKPFNRLGLDTNVSPFLKMSFEQTCAFLTKATIEGDADRLETPSARLVIGKSIQGGTGSFDVLNRI